MREKERERGREREREGGRETDLQLWVSVPLRTPVACVVGALRCETVASASSS